MSNKFLCQDTNIENIVIPNRAIEVNRQYPLFLIRGNAALFSGNTFSYFNQRKGELAFSPCYCREYFHQWDKKALSLQWPMVYVVSTSSRNMLVGDVERAVGGIYSMIDTIEDILCIKKNYRTKIRRVKNLRRYNTGRLKNASIKGLYMLSIRPSLFWRARRHRYNLFTILIRAAVSVTQETAKRKVRDIPDKSEYKEFDLESYPDDVKKVIASSYFYCHEAAILAFLTFLNGNVTASKSSTYTGFGGWVDNFRVGPEAMSPVRGKDKRFFKNKTKASA